MPGDPDLLLGIDAGTSRIKALIVDPDGTEVWSSHIQTPWREEKGRIEMSVDDLRGAVSLLLAPAARELHRVRAVGIAGIAESGAPLDASGRPLAPVIAWHDPRGAEVVDRLQAAFGEDLERRIGQRIRTVSSVAKLGWLLGNGCGAPHRWLGVPELILWHLTGGQVTEHSLAARTGCFDITTQAYIPEVSAAAGVPADVWPSVAAAGQSMGRITTAGAEWSRLPRGAPVTIAGHDHLAGMDGVGAGAGDLVNSVGTAESVLGHSPTLPNIVAALEERVAISLRPGGEGWVALAGAARAGVVLGTAAAALGREAEELDALAAGSSSVDAAGLLAGIEAGDPLNMGRGSAGELWKGLLEALSARTFEAVERIGRVLYPNPTGSGPRMIVFGGGARSRPWMEIKARAAGMPVFTAGDTEAAARGATVFAGIAAGWWPGASGAPRPALQRVQPA